ncbi:putative Xaa-Pro aminopeptidase P [Erysiphe neolycopersici]|uniref:Probable Xaa-Pro aminopeptidase P n=1 Tax=Erysiphe neolycopersici TaxID=212602 RepID=A0A420I3L3_9PEZI|nr:putative Xaa-Pro aminopeptidase P [Erysiphe neolycopersici]
MDRVDTSDRLARLREHMKEFNVDIYIIPSEDSHSSEYIAACDARRSYISGFTGSAGCAVVTLEKAALATDGRYFNQAAKQLDSNWLLLKQGIQDFPTWQEWAAVQSKDGKVAGVDPKVITAPAAKKLTDLIKKKGGKGLIAVDLNLVDLVWGSDRPKRPILPVKILGQEYTGKDTQTKLKELRIELEKKKSAGIVISMLDEIAWLFNLRGSDIPYNPVFFSYATITPTTATLYINSNKLNSECSNYLKENEISIRPYEEIFEEGKLLVDLSKHKNETTQSEIGAKRILVSTKTSWALERALKSNLDVEEIRSPIGDAKAVKNETELAGMRACHIRDGAALIEFFSWLEHKLLVEKAVIDEVTAADKLEELRSKQENYVGLSFETISSSGPNAAVIHYAPKRNNCSIIDPGLIYLCDSGAQYLDGTTDTTRTLHFTQPTEMEKKAYTLVLKGNIALDTVIFPQKTTGFALDTLARQFLWEEGLDYRHGTGHGVGSYLNVHEGPIGIGTRIQYSEVPLAPGNVISNEPGYYEDGVFGIRIENVIIVREVKTKQLFGEKSFLGFEHVTMVPYCRKLIDERLLTCKERDWINNYHEKIWTVTKGYFTEDSVTRKWLERETRPL